MKYGAGRDCRAIMTERQPGGREGLWFPLVAAGLEANGRGLAVERITGVEACRAGGRARACSAPLPQVMLARDPAGVDLVSCLVEFPAYR